MEHKEELGGKGSKVHNCQMSIVDIPVITGKVTVMGKTYDFWLLGTECSCYAPQLESEYLKDFGNTMASGMKYYSIKTKQCLFNIQWAIQGKVINFDKDALLIS